MGIFVDECLTCGHVSLLCDMKVLFTRHSPQAGAGAYSTLNIENYCEISMTPLSATGPGQSCQWSGHGAGQKVTRSLPQLLWTPRQRQSDA